jgi:hypothetical protein
MNRLVIATALACAALGAPAIADACGNSVERVVDRTNEEVRKAELLLAKGDNARAIRTVRDEFGDRALARPDGKVGHWLHDRAQRVMALAIVRSKGTLAVGGELGGKTDAQRRNAVAWAVLTLRLRLGNDTDPVKTVDLAQGLALQATGRDEAHTLLKQVADGDLMPSAEGWALLAELRKERGDVDGSKQAVERCKQVGSDKVKCDVSENS